MNWYVADIDEGLLFAGRSYTACREWAKEQVIRPSVTRYGSGQYEVISNEEGQERVASYHIIRHDKLERNGFEWILDNWNGELGEVDRFASD